MKTFSICFVILLALSQMSIQAGSLNEQFSNPGPEYRGAPFWSWNEDLNGDELAWQIRSMKEQGMGGYFMHSRVGLITPYMGEKWLDMIERCADEAKATNTYAWLYDEDRWASGFAGGIVPAKGVEYRQKSLALIEMDITKDTKVEEKDGRISVNGRENAVAWFACRKVDGRIEDIKRISLTADHGLPDGTHVLLLCNQPQGDNQWFNGYAYVDTMSPKVIRAFIDSTYEPYREKLGGRFGREIPGIFTDEPNITPMAWTERLPEAFQKRYGYDILDYLTSLYFEVGDWQKVRHDYRSLTADLFLEAYSRQLYDWCDKYNLQFTGHYLAEDTLVSQLERAGSCMPNYEYEHVPGIDHLRRSLGTVALIKQVSSAANQLGRERVLSETFGGGGWNMNFADQKWCADWQFALGVNFVNQHLSLYSARGTRKRDYPPSIFHQQPYWKHYKAFNDYCARVCLMLTQGRFKADVLVIHPIASAWCVYSPNDKSKAQTLAEAFERTSRNLVQLHREFEYGDEKLMAKYAKVKGKELVVWQMKYKTVVIPPAVTLSGSTYGLLKRFIDAGGTVIAIKPTPTLLDGKDSPEIRRFFDGNKGLVVIEDDKAHLDAALEAVAPRAVSVRDESGSEAAQVVLHRRQDGARQIIFLANTDRNEGCDVTLAINGHGKLEDWDLDKGTSVEIPARRGDSGTAVDVHLTGAGSKLLVLDESAKSTVSDVKQPVENGSLELSDAWNVRRLDPNAVTLDICSYRIGDGEWQGTAPVIGVQREMERRPDGTEVALRFSFDIAFTPDERPIFLVLEQPNIYTMKLNGKSLDFKDAGWWVDKSFHKVDISRLAQSGENTLEMSCKFVNPKKPGTLVFVPRGVELESVYIIGDFAVQAGSFQADGPAGTLLANGGFKLVEESLMPVTGDLVMSGYPFYAGGIEMSQSFDIEKLPDGRAYMELDVLDAITAKVKINNRDAGLVYWEPYRIDITDYLKPGRNRIRIVLSNSLRNLLGPHHHRAGEFSFTSPGSFLDDKNWTDGYHFVKLGIPGKARICWEK